MGEIFCNVQVMAETLVFWQRYSMVYDKLFSVQTETNEEKR